MTDGNYIKHFKRLGKFCKIYDNAADTLPDQQTLLAVTIDQVADADPNANAVVLSLLQGAVALDTAAASRTAVGARISPHRTKAVGQAESEDIPNDASYFAF